MKSPKAGSWKTYHPLRVKFLKDHPELWKLSPKEIVRAMQKAGVVSKKTYYEDVKVRNLMREALK